MKSRVTIEWSIIVLTVAGCATSPPSLNEPLSISSNDLWTEPHKYDRKYVVVTGLLHQRNYLYFEDVVTTNNIKPVIHIRLEHPDMGKLDAEVATADCENQFVRVYGFFRQWDQYESVIDGVYRIVKTKRQRPGPEDIICWSNSDADPWQERNTISKQSAE